MTDFEITELLSHMLRAAASAARTILRYYNGEFSSWTKDDTTPVTEADLAASDIIISYLKERYPSAAILCEETAEELDSDGIPLRHSARTAFIIDPLDGTRSFIQKNGQFAVSISYVEDHVGMAAVIYVPVENRVYYAAKGYGAWRANAPTEDHVPFTDEKISVSKRTHDLVLLVSNTRDDVADLIAAGAEMSRVAKVLKVSSCLKGCMIAEGTADVHYKFASYTKEWDTSAEEIICREAGGVVTDAYGAELISNRPDYVNHRGIRILNDSSSALIRSLD